MDWEQKNIYNLTISVSDSFHTVYTQLYITVIDINDNRPEFTQSIYRTEISESVAESAEVIQLHANDKDQDKTLFFSLHAAQNPISLKMFRIDSVSGIISVAQPLDRELIAEHVLIVIVKDQGTPAKRNYGKVFITITDHNDHAPEFTTKIIQGKVYETSAIGSNIVNVLAIDRDLGENAHINYALISGNIGNVFNIDNDMGTIRLAKALGTNTLSEYMLQVKATDNGKPSLFSQIPVQIIVDMVDNAPPKFTKFERAVEIYENVPIGTYVLNVEAKSTSSLLYDIIYGNIGDIFFVNPSTGVITTKDQLDYESNKYVQTKNLVLYFQFFVFCILSHTYEHTHKHALKNLNISIVANKAFLY